MHCPECGCKLTLKSEICPECGENFEGMDDNEKKRVFNRPLSSNKKKVNFVVDPGNVNGHIVEEGSSFIGGKYKRGSRSSRSAITYYWSGGLGSEE